MSSARSASGRRASRTNRPSVLALEGRTLLTASPRVDTFVVPPLSAAESQIIDGPDGDLWYTGATGAIVRITTTGQVTQFPLPMPSGGTTPALDYLTAGPAGAVWAVDAANNQVDRIAHDGQVETFPLPVGQVEKVPNGWELSDSGPIVAGADGNLWFAASSSTPNAPGVIDRITPQGVITTFPLPEGGGSVEDLAAGPDGVWFTDPLANRVGEVDASGHVVEYAAPSPSVKTEDDGQGLAVGPDGDAYYITLGEYPSIVKVAPGGAMEQVFDPDTPTLVNLVAGPGGVYFEYTSDEGSTDELDRLAPDGTLTTVMTGPPSATSMAFGSDGNLWMAGFDEISRVVLNPATPVPGPSLVIAGAPGPGNATSPVAAVGEASSTPLAFFANSAGVTPTSATIDWGDGSAPTTGTLVNSLDPTSGQLVYDSSTGVGVVTGSHAYAQAGNYSVTVTINGTGPDGSAMTASTVETVSAVAPTPSLQSSPGLEAGKSMPFQGSILFFTTPTTLDDSLLYFTTPTTLDGSPSDFTAKVDWGDGSAPTAGTVVGGQGPASSFIPYPGTPTNYFEVSGGHTYATAGSYTIQVTLTDAFGHVSTESTPIEVFPGRLGLSLTPPTGLIAGPPPFSVAYDGLNGINFGTLDDFLGWAATGTDTVTIDWGDGSAPTAQTYPLTSDSPGEGPTSTVASFDIGGMHEYAKAGDYTVKIFAADQQGDLIEASTTAQVGPAQLSVGSTAGPSGSPDPYYSTVGQVATGPLAAITPPDSTDPASDFTATVDWGDGSAPTIGTIALAPASIVIAPLGPVPNPAAGQLEVSGDHTYASAGFYEVTVTVDGPDGSTAQYTGTATVLPANVPSGSPVTQSSVLTAGVASASAAIASFTPQDPTATASDFTATVDWGDGSPVQPATIQPTAPASGSTESFNILAGHTYAQAGTDTMTITVVGPDGIPDIILNQVTVSAPAPPVIVSPVVVANPTPPTPSPSPIALPEPTPIPTPILAPMPTPILAPMPVVSSSVPLSMARSFAVVLPSPFPRFAPTVKPSIPKPSRHPAPKAAKPHVEAKPVHVTLPKKHPAAPARLAKKPG